MTLSTFAASFETFLASIPGAERIDDLAAEGSLIRAKRADFLFANRSIVCEVKSLQSRTSQKQRAILSAAGIQLPKGGAWLDDLLKGRPDGDEIYDRVLNAGTTALSDGLAEANKQIRATKEALGLGSAGGLVIVLHGSVKDINPNVMVHRIVQRFAKNDIDGRPYHDHINVVCILSEIHKFELPTGARADVVIPLTNPRVAESRAVNDFIETLHERWAAFNGRKPLVANMTELPPPR
jgi:hypothetical protein